MDANRHIPAWAWCLAFLSLGMLLVEHQGRTVRALRAQELRAGILPTESEHLDPATASTRALRRLPGIGTTRAIHVTEARWLNGPGAGSLPWPRVSGIGPRTAEGVTTWLRENGADHPDVIER